MLPVNRPFWSLVAVPLVVFLIHLPSLGNGFHYDDGHSLLRNPHIRSLAHIPAFFTDPTTFSENPAYAMYRPLVLVSYALNYAWGGYDPFGYQLFNLLVHCLTALLAYLLLRQLHLPGEAALIGALLFGLHPVQTEPVNYVSSRSESLAGLFYLTAFAAYLQAARSRWRWQILSLGAFAFALLSKTTAITLPLALLLYEWLLSPERPFRLSVRRHLPYWLLAGAYLFLYHTLAGGGIEQAGQVRPLLIQLATQTKALVHYFALAGMPVGLNVYPQFQEAPSFASPPALLGLLAGASLLVLALFRPSRHPLLVFGLAWFATCLLPTLIVPLHILVNDHRLYLSLFGLTLILAHLSSRVRPRWLFYLLGLLFAVLTAQRDHVWRDELTLWQDAVSSAPLMPEPYYNLGYAHHLAGHLPQARLAYEQAVALSPQYARAWGNLGAIYREEGRLDQAESALIAALEAQPEMVEVLNNLGLVYRDMQKLDQAEKIFQQVLRLQPELAEAHFNLGLVYRDQGESDKAFTHLNRALQLDPGLKTRFPHPPTTPPGR